MQQLQGMVSSKTTSSSVQSEFDNTIEMVLKNTAATGIKPLFDALTQDDDEPSQAVAEILRGLSEDLKLDEDATAEDLLTELTKGLTRTPSTTKH